MELIIVGFSECSYPLTGDEPVVWCNTSCIKFYRFWCIKNGGSQIVYGVSPVVRLNLDQEKNAKMKIEKISVIVFKIRSKKVSDTDGHTHPGPEHDSKEAMLTITTDDGHSGYAFGSPESLRPYVIDNFVKKVFIDQDPMDREKLWINLAKWQRGSGASLTDRTMAVAEMALWDLAGRMLNIPVWKLLGGYREKVPAYGSTMCGDEWQVVSLLQPIMGILPNGWLKEGTRLLNFIHGCHQFHGHQA